MFLLCVYKLYITIFSSVYSYVSRGYSYVTEIDFIRRVDKGRITRTVKGLESFHGGNSTFINSFDKINSCFNLPPTQYHSFFRN